MENADPFEEFLRKLRQAGSELADALRQVWEEDPDFIRDVLRGQRLGIPPMSLNAEDVEETLPVFKRIVLVEALLDKLANDLDTEFASLVRRHRKLGRDRLFFSDMRNMTADLDKDGAVLSPAHREKLKRALADHDLAGRMCLTASPANIEERDTAWWQFEERYHKLIYHLIHTYRGTSELDQHEKQDVMQKVLIQLMRSACKYDARMASLNTYVTKVAGRACSRFSRLRAYEPLYLIDDAPTRDGEGSADLPAAPDWDDRLGDLLALFPLAMAYREIDAASRGVYAHILALKREGQTAQEIAEQINRHLNPSPPLNENSVNQRWNELKGWLREEDRRAETFEGTMSAHHIDTESKIIYHHILHLKLRGWLPCPIAESCNRDFSPAKPLTEDDVEKLWVMLKKWMAEWLRGEHKGKDRE